MDYDEMEELAIEGMRYFLDTIDKRLDAEIEGHVNEDTGELVTATAFIPDLGTQVVINYGVGRNRLVFEDGYTETKLDVGWDESVVVEDHDEFTEYIRMHLSAQKEARALIDAYAEAVK